MVYRLRRGKGCWTLPSKGQKDLGAGNEGKVPVGFFFTRYSNFPYLGNSVCNRQPAIIKQVLIVNLISLCRLMPAYSGPGLGPSNRIRLDLEYGAILSETSTLDLL